MAWSARCVAALTPTAILCHSQFPTDQRHSKKETIRQVTGLLGLGSNHGFSINFRGHWKQSGRDWGKQLRDDHPLVSSVDGSVDPSLSRNVTTRRGSVAATRAIAGLVRGRAPPRQYADFLWG